MKSSKSKQVLLGLGLFFCVCAALILSSHFNLTSTISSLLPGISSDKLNKGDMTVRMFKKGEEPPEYESEEEEQMDDFFRREIASQSASAKDIALSLSGQKKPEKYDDGMEVKLVPLEE